MKTIIKKIVIAAAIGILMALNFNCLGQDTIVKIDGARVFGKVIAFTPSMIEYKKADSLLGPTYKEIKSKVLEVRFKNGIIESITDTIPKSFIAIENTKARKEQKLEIHTNVFIRNNNRLFRLNRREINELANSKNTPELNALVKKEKTNNILHKSTLIGIPIVFAGAGMMINSIFSGDAQKASMDSSIVVVLAGSVVCDFNIYFFTHGQKIRRKIAKKYNETF